MIFVIFILLSNDTITLKTTNVINGTCVPLITFARYKPSAHLTFSVLEVPTAQRLSAFFSHLMSASNSSFPPFMYIPNPNPNPNPIAIRIEESGERKEPILCCRESIYV